MTRKIKPKGIGQQPRSLAPKSLAIQPSSYKASMRTEIQKFPDSQKTKQLLIEEELDSQELESIVEKAGLDLSVSENRALHAIQKLLDRTNYRGNLQGEKISSTQYRYQGLSPRLSITYSDYFEAYELKMKGNQYYNGKQAVEALQALKKLAFTPRTFIYSKKSNKDGRKRDVIIVTGTLITIIEGFKGLTEEETAQVVEGKDLPDKRQTRLILEFNPIMLDQIDTFYVLKPTAFYSEIRQLLGGKKGNKTIYLFAEWLLTLSFNPVKIGKDKLTEILRLDRLIRDGHRDRMEVRLQDAFQVAKKLEYLLDYREDTNGLLVFQLNPIKCRRLKESAKAEAAEAEEEG